MHSTCNTLYWSCWSGYNWMHNIILHQWEAYTKGAPCTFTQLGVLLDYLSYKRTCVDLYKYMHKQNQTHLTRHDRSKERLKVYPIQCGIPGIHFSGWRNHRLTPKPSMGLNRSGHLVYVIHAHQKNIFLYISSMHTHYLTHNKWCSGFVTNRLLSAKNKVQKNVRN